MQFREDMVRIVEHVGRKAPTGRQTILVSATLTHSVRVHPPASCPKQDFATTLSCTFCAS